MQCAIYFKTIAEHKSQQQGKLCRIIEIHIRLQKHNLEISSNYVN